MTESAITRRDRLGLICPSGIRFHVATMFSPRAGQHRKLKQRRQGRHEIMQTMFCRLHVPGSRPIGFGMTVHSNSGACTWRGPMLDVQGGQRRPGCILSSVDAQQTWANNRQLRPLTNMPGTAAPMHCSTDAVLPFHQQQKSKPPDSQHQRTLNALPTSSASQLPSRPHRHIRNEPCVIVWAAGPRKTWLFRPHWRPPYHSLYGYNLLERRYIAATASARAALGCACSPDTEWHSVCNLAAKSVPHELRTHVLHARLYLASARRHVCAERQSTSASHRLVVGDAACVDAELLG
jgi:hypothetical protein